MLRCLPLFCLCRNRRRIACTAYGLSTACRAPRTLLARAGHYWQPACRRLKAAHTPHISLLGLRLRHTHRALPHYARARRAFADERRRMNNRAVTLPYPVAWPDVANLILVSS